MRRSRSDKLRSSFWLILPVLLSISLGSCYPTFTHPIPPPSELRADPHVLGTWIGAVGTAADASKQQLSIFQRSSGFIDVVWTYGIDSKVFDGVAVLIYEGYTTSVNEHKFLCLRPQAEDHNRGEKHVAEAPFAIIANYETPSDSELKIRLFSTQKIVQLIKDGKLKGEIVKKDAFEGLPFREALKEEMLKGHSFDQVTVTSPSDELVEMIAQEGVGAFLGEGEYHVLVFSRGAYQPAKVDVIRRNGDN